jgi:hypothetical protein
MAKKSNSSAPQFVVYDPSLELKMQLEVAGTASLLACQNMEVISAPGLGKTSILHFMARQVFGGMLEEGGHYLKLECTPSTRVERVIGYENPLFMLDPDAKEKGIPRFITEGTPRDPNVWHVLLNERSRLNEMAADALIPVMDLELNRYKQVTFWGDSNHLPQSERFEALGDRFALRIHYPEPVTDVEGVMSKPPLHTWTFDVPNWDEIIETRAALEAWRIGGNDNKTFHLIKDALNTVASAIPGTAFRINPRRVVQWTAILYAMGFHASGEAHFGDLPLKAFQALSFCYPTKTPVEALEWRKLVMASVDPLETAIAEFEHQAIMQWKDEYPAVHDMHDVQARQQALRSGIGKKLAELQKEIAERFGNDSRAVSVSQHLTLMFQKMFKNLPPEQIFDGQ